MTSVQDTVRPADREGDFAASGAEQSLIARCQAGDQRAFEELYRWHRGHVAHLVYRMRGTATDMEDLVQEVFVQVLRSIGSFRGASQFSTWLHRLTLNVVLMHRRSAASRPVLTVLSDALQPSDPHPLPDEETDDRARLVAFRELLGRLSDKKRQVLVLHDIEGVRPDEIAKTVGISVLTVRTRLFYARREMSELLAAEVA